MGSLVLRWLGSYQSPESHFLSTKLVDVWWNNGVGDCIDDEDD